MIQMIGGEMPEYVEERPPAGGHLYRHLLDRLPARTRVLVAGPHDDALIDALTPGLEVTCLVRSQPEAERLAGRGVRVLCGTLPKLAESERYDTVVAFDGAGRLCSPEGPQYDWIDAVRALKRTLRPGGTLLLVVENELGVHRLVDPGTPTAPGTGDWRPLGEFGTAPGRADRLAAILGAEGLPVSGLAAVWPLPGDPTMLATPETLRYGPLDSLAAFVAAVVASAYQSSKTVLSDPRRMAAAAVRRGLGTELAPGWLAVAHVGPRPTVAFPVPPALIAGDTSIVEVAGGPDGWQRRVLRGDRAANGPLPAGRLLEELMLTAALRHDLPTLRRLLTDWMSALPETVADNVIVPSPPDATGLARLDPGAPDHADALGRFARTLLTGGYAHPWPGVTDVARLTEILAGAAGLPGTPPVPDPQPAPDTRREHHAQVETLRRQLAEATERNHFYEVELGKRDAELGRAKAQIAMFSGSLGYRAAKAGLVIARKALRKGKS